MRSNPAKSAERRARRKDRVAENAGLAAATGKEPLIAPKQGLEALPRAWGSRDVTYPIPSSLERLMPWNAPKRPKKKRKKAPTLSKLKKDLWKEISLLVRSWSNFCWACFTGPVEVAAHIVPSNDGAATRYFLPNLYPCCTACNTAERFQRGTWVYRHREIFGADMVDALYEMSRKTFQLKKHWVLEQTERMRRLRNVADSKA